MAETAVAEPTEGAVADRLPPAPVPASSLATAALPDERADSRSTFADLQRSVKEGEATTAKAREALGAARDAQREAIEAKAATVNPMLDRARQGSEALSTAVAQNPTPKAPIIPEPPSKGLRAFLAPAPEGESPEASIAKLIQGLGLMAGLIGGTGKKDAIGGLVALKGAMQGWHEGDKERADRAFADWKAKTDALLQRHDLDVKDWENWFKASNLSVDQQLRGATLAALEQDNLVAAKAFMTGSLENALGHIEKTTHAADSIRAKMAEILASRELSVTQMVQTAELRREALAQQERLAEANRATQIAIAQGNQALRLDMYKDRVDEKMGKEAKGEFYDREQGKMRQITEGELRSDLSAAARGEQARFKHLGNQEKAAVDRLVLAPSLLGRLDELIDKITKAAPGENITQGMLNRLKKRAGISADIAEFENLKTDMAVELAGALSGGQPRISILSMVREDAQPGMNMTTETAKRQVAAARNTIYNRLTSLTGDPEAWKKLSQELRPYKYDDEKPPLVYDRTTGDWKK